MTGPLVIDDATTQALQMFNARLAHQADLERAERRVQKMARAKDDAAARVRALENDPQASATDRTEAAAAYRAAVEAWDRARNGEPDPAPAAAPETDAAETDAPETDDGTDTAEPDTAETVDGTDTSGEAAAAAQDSADAPAETASTDH